MIMIHRRLEGGKLKLGINYFINWDRIFRGKCNNDNTIFQIIISIPFLLIYGMYEDGNRNMCKGWQIASLDFRYRFREPQKFNKAHLYSTNTRLTRFGTQIIKTLEEREDEGYLIPWIRLSS